jgi:triphosphoribosyl-dephospho-CoA synthase
VLAAFPGARELASTMDALGPFTAWRVATPPAAAKAACVALEAEHPAARLVDLDVYAADGAQVDRRAVGLPGRACLCCAEPARECIRAGLHTPEAVVARARALLARAPLDRLAASLARGLREELHLTPKPGLVDLENSGSHADLSLDTMERSIQLVAAYLDEIVESLVRDEPLPRQVALGRAAEARMRSRFGTNTHKGAVFLGGALLVARHRARRDDEPAIRRALADVGRELAVSAPAAGTHGADARRRFGVAGILGEVEAGLPSVFEVALPAFRGAIARGAAPDAARFAMLAALMQTVEDTTALHRGGAEGLATLRQDGARLAAYLRWGGDHAAFLRERNEVYRVSRLTMGGVADLLGVALGVLAWRG